LLRLRGGRMREPKTPSSLTDRRSERLSIEDGRMCLCGVLGAEAGVPSPEVAEGILSLFRRCIDDLSQRIGGPGAEARAFHVMATLEGGMMLAPAYRSIEAFNQAAASLAYRSLLFC
jgi:TetR/AcrR family transcriptional repressor of nem operon